MSEIDRITRLLEKTFDEQPWYGSSVMSILSGLDGGITKQHLGEGHSIFELVNHMIAWRRFATHRLKGNTTFKVTEKKNFPTSGSWKSALKDLQKSQKQLLHAVRKFPESKLHKLVPGVDRKSVV